MRRRVVRVCPSEVGRGHSKTVHSRTHSVHIPTLQRGRTRYLKGGGPALAVGWGSQKRVPGRHPDAPVDAFAADEVDGGPSQIRTHPHTPTRARETYAYGGGSALAVGTGLLTGRSGTVPGCRRGQRWRASCQRGAGTVRGRSCRAKQGAMRRRRGSETFRRAKRFWEIAPYRNLALEGSGSGCGSTRAALRRMSDKGSRAGISAVRVMVGYVSQRGGVVRPEQAACDAMFRATGARTARAAGVVRGMAAAQWLAAAIEATPDPLTPGI